MQLENDSQRPWYRSKGFLASLATAVVALVGGFGLDLGMGAAQQIIAGVVAAVAAIVGGVGWSKNGKNKKPNTPVWLLALVPALAVGCAQAQRRVPQQADQRANEQGPVSASPNEGFQVNIFVGGGKKIPKLFDRFANHYNSKTGGGNTADASVQGDSQQTTDQQGDASGETDQTQDVSPEADVNVTPGSGAGG